MTIFQTKSICKEISKRSDDPNLPIYLNDRCHFARDETCKRSSSCSCSCDEQKQVFTSSPLLLKLAMDLDPDEVFRDDDDDPDNPFFQVHTNTVTYACISSSCSISLLPFQLSLLYLVYRKGSRRRNSRFTWLMLPLKCSARLAPPWVLFPLFLFLLLAATFLFSLFQSSSWSLLWFCNGWTSYSDFIHFSLAWSERRVLVYLGEKDLIAWNLVLVV